MSQNDEKSVTKRLLKENPEAFKEFQKVANKDSFFNINNIMYNPSKEELLNEKKILLKEIEDLKNKVEFLTKQLSNTKSNMQTYIPEINDEKEFSLFSHWKSDDDNDGDLGGSYVKHFRD